MKKYRVLAYQGVFWLKDLGTFDLFDEAQDALLAEEYVFCGEYDSEDYEMNHEVFMFESRIEEVWSEL